MKYNEVKKSKTSISKEKTTRSTEKAKSMSTVDLKTIWDYLKDQGLNDCGIAGLMGNLYTDSSSILSEAQLSFLVEELSKKYQSVWNVLKTANTVVEASNAVLLQYECPIDQSLSIQTIRANYGQKYYNEFAEQEKSKEKEIETEKTDLSSNKNENKVEVSPKGEKQVKAFAPYTAMVTVSLLNCRQGPSMNHKINETIKQGSICSIIEESGNWGCLESGKGWVCLDYIKKI